MAADRVEHGPADLPIVAHGSRTERPGVHRQRQPVAMADREDEQAEQQSRVPATAQPADPARLTQRGQVLRRTAGSPGTRRGRHRRTGPTRGLAGRASPRVASNPSSARTPHPTDAIAITRAPSATPPASAASVIRIGPRTRTTSAVGSAFAAENRVLTSPMLIAAIQSGASDRPRAPGRMPPERQSGRERDRRQDERRPDRRREGESDEPGEGDTELHERAGPSEGAVELGVA